MQNLLSDLVVVDLTRALAGPQAAMMLGDLGARVIKVESPDGGDDSRGWGPPFVGTGDSRESTYFLSANRNKESVTADLKSPEGKEFLTKLVRRADVLVENFRPGVLDRLGFSVEQLHQLNPGLVILSITGFGHDGPEGGRAGYDQIAQGEGGLMSITGAVEATKIGVPIADLLAGMYGAYGALAALHERSITGKGRVVRTSLLASVIGVHAFHGTKWTVAGELPERVGNHHAQIAPYGMYRTKDDMVQVAVGSEGQWRTFAPLVGIDPADERFVANAQRVAHRDDLTALIELSFSQQPADVWLKHLAEHGIPAGKVRDFQQVYEWEQTRSQGLLIDVEHPTLGRVQLPGPPLRFDDQPYAGARGVNLPPPRLGEHNESVRAWLDHPDGSDSSAGA